MKIKTSILQEMLSKAIKGASNNRMIPITSLIGIELKENILTLMTTDGSNHLRIRENLETEIQDATKNFYVIINAETFAKLIAKTTSEYVTLTINENYLEIKGNGAYKLDIPVDEDGNIIKFTTFDINATTKQELSIELLKNILNTAKVSVAKTMEMPCLTGYYIADKIVSTDSEMMCCINQKLIDNPILISSEMAELLQLLSGDTVTLSQEENKLMFETKNITIYGKQLEGLEQYPVQQLDILLNQQYDNVASVKKQELLNVLDRMSLFIGDYDKNGVFLSFTENGLQLTSQKSNASELIELNTTDFVPFNCLINIEMLKSQVQNNSTDTVKFCYGQETSIKILDGNTTIIICLLDQNS